LFAFLVAIGLTLAVSLLNKTTTDKKDCQQVFLMFNVNLKINFQIDRLLNQFDRLNIFIEMS